MEHRERVMATMSGSNVVAFERRRSKVTGLEGLVTIETLSAVIGLEERHGRLPLDYTIGQPCGCAFCALRAGNASWFRRGHIGHDVTGINADTFETLGNVGFSEHLT